ncbi:MFS general substrate transporter [Basidiobolus meristosporus CBS 931.73]|uniref:MFS general substrate transporter n=1 Tax=Basidiobolus meristosporus CBS 931.73 TaxID=1314790 RepID=A0A1Y1YTN5_9FUNG|nr:MFS general substrate transporter [Basidiobolus meristosporus CBS 931.73]|eukprot:ORY01400.1 MFS general substrate transporter [Basidiobolus meristosporus CBS 931.73]
MQPGTPETPLPKAQFFVLSCVLLAEPVVLTVIFPFMYYMVRDFGIAKEEKEIGFYVGLLAAVFSIAEMISGLFWGVVSDKIGRRPVILMGLIGSFLGCTMFGLSKSYGWAIFARCVSGLLNGNVGVVKSVIGELTDRTNQAKGFSLVSLMWGAGIVIGPTIAGLLSNPVEQFPFLFGSSEFLKEYPYFLPCITAASITIPGFFMGFFVLEETLESKKSRSTDAAPTENSPLLAERTDSVSSSSTQVEPSASGPFAFPVLMAILGYGLLAFQTTLCDELFPVWASSPIPFGGLSFTVSKVGLALSICGAFIVIGQLAFYPPCQRKLGTLPFYRWSLFAYMVTYATFQLGSVVAKKVEYEGWHEGWVWAIVIFDLAAKTLCGAGAYTNIFILLNNAAPNEKYLGTINGASQCVAAFTRAISPALGGITWSWSLKAGLPYPFNHQFAWILLTLCSGISLIQSFWITDEKTSQKEETVVPVEQSA